MARVEATVEECEIEDDGRVIAGVCAVCSRCGHEATAFGTGEKSVKRAMVTLKEECPEDQRNFYVADDGGGESPLPDPAVRPWWEAKR